MKAIVQERYGLPHDVLSAQDVPVPTVRDHEVLVKVRAASAHADIWHAVTGTPRVLRLVGGIGRPKVRIPGTDLAGHVEHVGRQVTRFKSGDEVFGGPGGLMFGNGGAFAEYAAVPEHTLSLKPARLTFEQAATIPTAGFIALMGLKPFGDITPHHRVLVNGAGGNVGAMVIQLCKARGTYVAGVDHTVKLAVMRALGADRVVDYTQDDLTGHSERYDFILDVAQTLPVATWKQLLTPSGLYWLVGHDHYEKGGSRPFGRSMPGFLSLTVRSMFDRQLPRPRFGPLPTPQNTMPVLMPLLEGGQLTPIIDRVFPLEQAADALRYLQTGLNPGRVVVTP